MKFRSLGVTITLGLALSHAGLASAESSFVATNASHGSVGPFTYNRSGVNAFLPDISLTGTIALAVFNDDPAVPTGENPQRTGFNLRELELAIQSVIDPYVRLDAYIAFSEGPGAVELEEGYITTLALPLHLQLRAGKIKMPFGRHNQKHGELWSFVTDPLVNHKILSEEGFNELAIVPSVLPPLPFFVQIEGGFGQGDNANNFDGGRRQDFAYSGRISVSGDIAENFTVLVGTSAAFGFNATASGALTSVYGGDLMLKWKPSTEKGLIWENEYIYVHRDNAGVTEDEGGAYSQLVAQFSKRWQVGQRLDWLGLPRFDEKHWRTSTMIKFMLTEFFALRAEYDLEDSDVTTPVHAGYLQMIFNVGPHGAHKF